MAFPKLNLVAGFLKCNNARPDPGPLEDAHILANAGRWNACVNRLYYACFYVISALLVRRGLSSSKHAGVRSLFNKQYVKTGKIPKDLARIYNDLFERRQEGDYIDFVRF